VIKLVMWILVSLSGGKGQVNGGTSGYKKRNCNDW